MNVYMYMNIDTNMDMNINIEMKRTSIYVHASICLIYKQFTGICTRPGMSRSM